MKKYNNIIQCRTLIIILSAILLIYVLIRAYTLSFTHDESLSFTIIEGSNVWTNTANNHKLNTVLMFLSKTLFGNSEFSLRLPNVLSFVLYLLGCFYVLRESKYNWLFFFGFCMILLNPFLIEFFSLARGYGLSLAFMLMSIFFLLKNGNHYLTSSTLLKDFIFTSLFASLAIYSNLAMANFFISILIIFIIKYWNFRKKHHLEQNFNIQFWGVLFVSCIPLFLGIIRLLKLKGKNQLYFGAYSFTQGFDSLVRSSIYFTEYPSWILPAIKTVVVLFLSIGVLSIIRKQKYDESLFTITLLIVLLIIGLFLEHFLFVAKYPIGRSALFYIPILAIFIYHLFLHLVKEYKIKKLYYIPIIICLITPLFVNFVAGSNFTYTKTWRYDAHTKDAMKIIRDCTQDRDCKASISNNWLFEPTINYYIRIWEINLNSANRNGVDLNSDFIYKQNNSAIPDNFKNLYSYDDIKSSLLMKIKINKKINR